MYILIPRVITYYLLRCIYYTEYRIVTFSEIIKLYLLFNNDE